MKPTLQQTTAIQKTEGPCVILAGAGTGKTKTIVDKIHYLIQNKIYSPEKIVCITFSNEACNSLLTRIQKILPENSKLPIIKTFHAFSADIIRENGNENFSILTPDDAKIVLHANLKVPVGNCHRYIASIHTAKDLGITPEKLEEYLNKKLKPYENTNLEKKLESIQFQLQTIYLHSTKKDKHELNKQAKEISDIIKLQKFIKTWNAYEKLKKIKNYQDYSDLNKNALDLLKQKPEIISKYEYLIVDEFQDTNKIQLELLKNLSQKNDITVVGDINQSIYRFRGAYNKNLDEFKKHFNITSEEIFALDKSYRSTNKILKAAHKLILNNYVNKEDCFEVKNAFNKEGENIEVHKLKDSKEEARKVVELVKEQLKKGTPENEICVMFRNHNYGRIIRKTLEFNGIKFCSVAKESLLTQNSVKTITNYLTILEKLKTKSNGGEYSWWELLYNLNLNEKDLISVGKFIKQNRKEESLSVKIFNELPKLELTEDGKTKTRIFIERIKLIIPALQEKLPKLIQHVIHCSGIINEKTKKEKQIQLNLNKFFEVATTHSTIYEPDLSSFLHHLEIIKDLKIEIPAAEIEENGVRLMTLHSTKGLEYSTVILTNLTQKRFPMEKFTNNSLIPLDLTTESQITDEYQTHEYEKLQQLFEERRLCYVAFTRAKQRLILTFAEKYGNKKFYPSQFLNEIQFQQNPDINLFIDDKTLYQEPEAKLEPASNFIELQKNNFENITPKENQKTETVFSPTALLTFEDCQKKYEYKYIYNMPEEKTPNWEAMRLGSFVHLVLEKGVKENLQNQEDFINCAKALHLKEDWESIDIDQAIHLVKVFHERNKNKFNKESKTEQKLTAEIEGLKFLGFADRIDFSPEGLEIIDYKTGSSNVPPKSRNWQLGFYALAAEKFGKVKKITLDMLKHEKPLEFTVDENGNAKSEYGRMEFNIQEVKEEILETARQIIEAKKSGFKVCPVEKNCEFCNERFHR